MTYESRRKLGAHYRAAFGGQRTGDLWRRPVTAVPPAPPDAQTGVSAQKGKCMDHNSMIE